MRHFERRQETPVAPRLDQVCVRREMPAVELFSKRIIIAETLLAAGGSRPRNGETEDDAQKESILTLCECQ